MVEYETVNLNISSKKLDCDDILRFLYASKIKCSIIKNRSIVYKNKKWTIEDGCNISLHTVNKDDIKNRIWKPLSKKYKLGCAHLKIPYNYSGCINKFI